VKRACAEFLAQGVVALVGLLAAGCAAGVLPTALVGAGQAVGGASLTEGLRRAWPATRNYADPAGPLYVGETDTAWPLAGDDLIVVSYNLRYAEALDAAVAAFAAREPLPAADIILLQEMDAPGVAALAEAWAMHYVYFPASVAEDGDDFGNAILSRWPLAEPMKLILPGLHPITGQQRTATRATVRMSGREVLVYSTHIETATAPPSLRQVQMAAVLADVPPGAERVIIGGDFNTITGRGVAELAEAYGVAGMIHTTGDLGPTVTRFGLRPSAADHIFVRGFDVQDAGVLDDVTASDHFPVWARLSMKE